MQPYEIQWRTNEDGTPSSIAIEEQLLWETIYIGIRRNS